MDTAVKPIQMVGATVERRTEVDGAGARRDATRLGHRFDPRGCSVARILKTSTA